jgi:hypothetical protein
VTLNVTPGTMNNVTLSGQVSGLNVGGQTIDFGGPVNGSTTTNADGTFCVTLPASGMGTFQAWADNGLSNVATATLSTPAPTITNFGVSDSFGVWTFTGAIEAPPTSNITVTLNNGVTLQNQIVTLNSNNTFSYSVTLTSADNGLVTCYATDQWNQQASAQTLVEGC